MKTAIWAALLLACSPAQAASPVVMFGPMCHWEFGNHAHHFTWGVEASYWKLSGNWPVSIDVGFEFGRPDFRIYSEAQAGLGLFGVSLGPVLEFGGGKGAHWGFQNSLWANLFAGFDYRWRYIDGTTYQCPGIYLKVPMVTDGYDEYRREHPGSEHHHFHLGD